MQDLSETLELIRLSIYLSFGIVGAYILFWIVVFVRRFYRNRFNKSARIRELEKDSWNISMSVSSIERFLMKKYKTFKPHDNYE